MIINHKLQSPQTEIIYVDKTVSEFFEGTNDVKKISSQEELKDILDEARNTSEDVILGGVHPILGAKMAEKGGEDQLRCRVVFTAPRAWAASGLDVNSLYEEISNSPIPMQGSRCLRAYGALKGYIYSSRDAKSAYLQSKLRRPGSDDPRTFVALPRQFWPQELYP